MTWREERRNSSFRSPEMLSLHPAVSPSHFRVAPLRKRSTLSSPRRNIASASTGAACIFFGATSAVRAGRTIRRATIEWCAKRCSAKSRFRRRTFTAWLVKKIPKPRRWNTSRSCAIFFKRKISAAFRPGPSRPRRRRPHGIALSGQRSAERNHPLGRHGLRRALARASSHFDPAGHQSRRTGDVSHFRTEQKQYRP